MSRGMLRFLAAGALAFALVGGTATVALAIDGDGEADVVVPVEEAIVEQAVTEEPAAEESLSEEPVIETALLDEPDTGEPSLPAEEPALAPEGDTTPPVVWVRGLDHHEIFEIGATFTIEIHCEDPESGITSCTENHGYETGDTVKLTTLGLNTFTATGVNSQGMVWSYSLEVWAQVAETQPVRAVFDGGRESYNGWFNAPITARVLGFSDTEFPIYKIVYRVGGSGDWSETAGDIAEIPFTEEGSYLLEYRSWDEAWQVSTMRRQWVNIDFTAPELTVPFEDGAVFDLDEELLLVPSCTDDRSGVDLCGSESAYLRTSEPGPHQVRFTATDNAWNTVDRIVRYTVLTADGELPPDEEPPTDEPTEGDDDGAGDPGIPTLPAGVDDPETLAYTGSDSAGTWTLLIGGLVLVVLGVAAAILTRRVWPSS